MSTAEPNYQGPPTKGDIRRNEDPDSLRTLTADEVSLAPVEFLWPSRIPKGTLTIFDGDPGLGKTTVLLDIAARVTTGTPMPNAANRGSRSAASVLYLSVEDGLSNTIVPRLKAAGADLSRVHLLFDTEIPTLPRSAEKILSLVIKNDIALIVFDPVVAFLGDGKASNNDADVRQALAALQAICEPSGCAAVLLRHLNKQRGNTNALYRGGGSIAWVAAARAGLLVAKDPEDPELRVLAATKANLSRLAESLAYRLVPVEVPGAGTQVRVKWLGTSEHEAGDLLEERRQGRSEERVECGEWLKTRLANGVAVARPVLIEEASKRGWCESLLKRASGDVGVQTPRESKAQGGTLWSLK